MKFKTELYKSLSLDFDKFHLNKTDFEIVGSNIFKKNGYIDINAPAIGYSFFTIRQTIAKVPQIDQNNYQGRSYTIEFYFNVHSASTGKANIFSILSDKLFVKQDTRATIESYTKFTMQINYDKELSLWANDTNNTKSYFTGYNWQRETSGYAYVSLIDFDKWYKTKIVRTANKYDIFVYEADGTLILDTTSINYPLNDSSLYFESFNLDSDNLKFSNYDSVNRETADRLMFGKMFTDVGGNIEIDIGKKLRISEPIQYISNDYISSNITNSTNNRFPASVFELNNSANSNMLHKKQISKFNDLITEDDLILAFSGFEDNNHNRTIIETFERSQLHDFFVLLARYNGKTIIGNDHYLNLYNNDSANDKTLLRSVKPICGNYTIFLKVRIPIATNAGHFFTTQFDSIIPDFSSTSNYNKLDFSWNMTTSPFTLYMKYYDTSDVLQTWNTISESKDDNDWFYFFIKKTNTHYLCNVYRNDFSVLAKNSKLLLSSVRQGTKPDYIVFGSHYLSTERLNIDIDRINVTFNYLKNQVSNNKYFSNSFILGLGL